MDEIELNFSEDMKVGLAEGIGSTPLTQDPASTQEPASKDAPKETPDK